MTRINIQFTRFSAFYSPLIATAAAGFLADEGLEPELSMELETDEYDGAQTLKLTATTFVKGSPPL